MHCIIWFIILCFIVVIYNTIKSDFFKERWNDGLEPIFYLISFTLLLASIDKFRKKDKKADIIVRLNWDYFLITLISSVILILCTANTTDSCNKITSINESEQFKCFCIILSIYAFSRVNEIFIAFVRDARQQLSSSSTLSGLNELKYYQRIMLAMRSYIELILLYGILQFSLSFGVFEILQPKLCNFQLNKDVWDSAWDAIYFSGVTIATIGYGDFTPKSGLSQFLVIYEVVNGFVLIVVSFTIYVSRSIVDKEYKNKNIIKAKIYQGEQSGFIAECIELPIVTQGQTVDEVIVNLREAISLHLEGKDLAALGFAPNPSIVVNYEMAAVCQN